MFSIDISVNFFDIPYTYQSVNLCILGHIQEAYIYSAYVYAIFTIITFNKYMLPLFGNQHCNKMIKLKTANQSMGLTFSGNRYFGKK